MPQRRCCVSSCSSTTSEGAILHAFPNPALEKNRDRFNEWVRNVGLAGEDDTYIFRNRRVCHIHFEKIHYYPKNRLCKFAVLRLLLTSSTKDPGNATPESNDQHPLFSQMAIIGQSTSGVSGIRSAPVTVDELPTSTSNKTNTRTNASESLQFKNLSTTEIELHKTVAKTQVQLRKCKNTNAGLKERLKIAKKFSNSEAFNAVTKNLSPAAQTFFAMQTRQACKHPKGRRFNLDEKILALSLYKPSPKAYRLLSQICVLPKKSTLNKLMARICLLPGPNQIVFEHLKKRVEKMPNSHRFCTLLFDKMAIAANLSYDKKNDYIKGFLIMERDALNTLQTMY